MIIVFFLYLLSHWLQSGKRKNARRRSLSVLSYVTTNVWGKNMHHWRCKGHEIRWTTRVQTPQERSVNELFKIYWKSIIINWNLTVFHKLFWVMNSPKSKSINHNILNYWSSFFQLLIFVFFTASKTLLQNFFPGFV